MSDEYRRIIRDAFAKVEGEMLEARQKIQAEREAAYEAEKPTLSELIADEMDEVERPYVEGWKIGR